MNVEHHVNYDIIAAYKTFNSIEQTGFVQSNQILSKWEP